ncbi:MAG: PIN domain-containing protein [Verrucomicrobia bacterium]|nr:PIN domain-containing protein [Verrucomicrobiota bacterium]
MSVEAFLDSNILLYVASKDPADRRKAARAAEIVAGTRFGVSLQVAQEFYHNARVKARLGITSGQAEKIISLLLSRPLVISDETLFAEARRITERYQLRYWDAAIVAAAARLGAPVLYSEDLNDGQTYDGVKVVNPFS